MFSSDNQEWGTPDDVYEARNLLHAFELDVCASAQNFKHEHYITQEEDAFTTPWTVEDPEHDDYLARPARCWMNPPYGRREQICKDPATCKLKRCAKRGYHTLKYVPGLYDWVKLAYQRSRDGGLVDCLLPSKTGSKWWTEFIWDNDRGRVRDGVYLHCIPGRLTFQGAPNCAPFYSVLVTFKR